MIGRKGSFGRVSYCPSDVFAIDTTFYVDRRSTDANIRWLYYVLSHIRLDAASPDSAIPGLDREDAYARTVALCDSNEQRAIACFLDRETAKIDALVAKKERLIELLEEERMALINGAVTRGLDPSISLKYSGANWMGNIPVHWNMAALRRRCSVASVRETQSFELDVSDANHTTYGWYDLLIEGGRKPCAGDLIYCRNVSPGAAALVTTEERFAMGQDVCIIRSRLDNPRWLNYYLSSSAMSQQLYSVAVGSTFDRINVSDIKSLLVPIVPRDEQDSISRFLDNETARIDALLDRVREVIQRVGELRSALVSAAVTGKIDVGSAV